MRERTTSNRPTGPRLAARPAAVTLLAAAAAVLSMPATAAAQSAAAEAAPESALDRALESRSKGAESARVVVFEIADFQCPFCAEFAEQVGPALHDKYVATGRVQWVFVNLPMHTHPLAWHAAEAALCAGVAGGEFWSMHDRLFAEQDSWVGADDPQAVFAGYAADLGVPTDAFRTCTEDDQVASIILQDLGSAVSAGVTGTPTFIVMQDQQVVDQLVGVKSVEEWSEVLEGALAEDTGGQ
ncbi:MAG: thioredoxin domain-containing protein [Longimicrobiales bacterium]